MFNSLFRAALCVLALWPVVSIDVARARESLNRIVAVVDDGVIMESELVDRLAVIKRDMRQSSTQAPPDSVLVPKVLDGMVLEKIQAQMAERAGIKADEETVRAQVEKIAEHNRMSVEEFRRNLSAQGIAYADFLDHVRNEIVTGTLLRSQVYSQVRVSDREVENYMKAKGLGGGGDPDYLLGHILIATPSAASPADVQKAKEKAEKLVADIKGGLDFKQAAMGASDDGLALKGGELGWRKKSQIPSLFADVVDKMKEGDVEGPIRSSSGYHIIKMLGLKGAGGHLINKTRVRHILIKTTEVLDDEEARQRLLTLKRRIEGGEDFATLARGHSDDKGSAIKGGELGWVQPGVLVPPFEAAMDKLAVNQLSDPVQTQYGWHLIQVLERQQSNDSGESEKSRAREEIGKRKAEEERELWLRRIRDEAYVEIRLQ